MKSNAIDVDFSADPPGEDDVPLLLQPAYARSKSMIFDELRNFRVTLKWCALDHSSSVGRFISFVVFFFLAILVPSMTSLYVKIPSTASPNYPVSLNKLVHLPESALAVIGFFTLSRFFSRYGLRQLLFLDELQEDSLYVRRGYTSELDKAFRYLAYILFPSFLVELAHKVVFFSSVKITLPLIFQSLPLNYIVFLLVLASWVYRTGVFLLVCILFRLTCELQILRLQGLHKLFEELCLGSDHTQVIFREHLRIRKQLWVTSHRYRFFIIGCWITISVSQLGALLLILASKADKSFFNSGDLVVCSAVQLSGFFLSLLGAARITHRAQGIVSIAAKWHMLVTCSATSDHHKNHELEADDTIKEQAGDGVGDGDSSSSGISISISNDPLSFQTRQALVSYMQHNNGGITVFGFALDRGLLHTLFAFEFSLVLWILSKKLGDLKRRRATEKAAKVHYDHHHSDGIILHPLAPPGSSTSTMNYGFLLEPCGTSPRLRGSTLYP